MPSSISNFNALPTIAPTRRSYAHRTLAAGLLVLAAGAVIARGIAAFAEHRDVFAFGTTHPRVERIAEVIPAVARHPGSNVIAVGSSQLLNGFDTGVFDAARRQAGVTVMSFNFGFNGATAASAERILFRLRGACERAAATPELLILEFPTIMSTKAAAKAGLDDGPNLQLTTAETLRADFRRSVGNALGTAASHYLLGNLEPSLVKEWIDAEIYGEKMPCGVRLLRAGEDAGDAGLTAFCSDLKKVFPERLPAWDEPSRGYRKMVFPETEASYRFMAEQARKPARMAADLAWRRRCCDIENLDFAASALEEFVTVAKQAQALSSHVMVMIPPVNTAWVKRSPAGTARLHKAIDAFEQRAGLHVFDWSEDPAFEPTDFVDTTHLDGLHGAKKLSLKMAEAAAGPLDAAAAMRNK